MPKTNKIAALFLAVAMALPAPAYAQMATGQVTGNFSFNNGQINGQKFNSIDDCIYHAQYLADMNNANTMYECSGARDGYAAGMARPNLKGYGS